MSELQITPEQVNAIFGDKPGEGADESFLRGFYAAQAIGRVRIAALAGWETAVGPSRDLAAMVSDVTGLDEDELEELGGFRNSPRNKSFDELAATAKASWSEDARALYEAASESFREETKAVQPLPRVPVDQSFLHAVIQSLTEAGDVSLVETAQHFLDSAPRDGFSTIEEAVEHGLRGRSSSWQYAWRAFFPEIDGEGKPLLGTFGEEYEWLDFESFKAALEAAQEAQEEEDRKPQEDETHRLGYSVWKRRHHKPGTWEAVSADEDEITDGSVEYGWRSFMPNHDEEGNLIEGLGEEYEWLDADSLEEARSQVALLQVEEDAISKARGLTSLSYSVWKRTPEHFGDWIPMARIDSPEATR